MSEETLYEDERTRTRADIAATFRSLAEQLETDGALTFADDDRTVTVHPPERPTFEVEIERESATVSVELEVEWTDSEGGVAIDESVPDEPDTVATGSLARFEVFRDRVDEWRWRLVHRNGNVIATGGEGYTTRQNALKGLRSVKQNAPDAEIVSKWETRD